MKANFLFLDDKMYMCMMCCCSFEEMNKDTVCFHACRLTN